MKLTKEQKKIDELYSKYLNVWMAKEEYKISKYPEWFNIYEFYRLERKVMNIFKVAGTYENDKIKTRKDLENSFKVV